MHYPCIIDTYFSTTYHMLVYDVICKTLGRIHPGISTSAEMCDYKPPKKDMELERNFSLILSSMNSERAL